MLVRSVTLLVAACFAAGSVEQGSEVGKTAAEEGCASCAPTPSAEDVGLLQLARRGHQEQADSTACTASGSDPYASGHKVDCCSGLQSCLGDWHGNGVFSYLCYATCPGSPAPGPSGACTTSGSDPYASGHKMDCCSGLQSCLGDWHSNGVKSYLCYATCPGSPAPGPAPPTPAKYHPHFDTSPDYLDIASRARGVGGNPGELSDNFYLVVADQGGCAGGRDSCCFTQTQVAEKMKAYVAARKAKNPNSQLLFVLAGGDNFYWTGAGEGRFSGTWANPYGEELTSVPWFAVFGNHDYGDSDPGSACPYARPRFTCDSTNQDTAACGGAKPYSVEPQGYNSNQLNADKGGVDGPVRANFHMPDYTYFYSIPDLDFELIAMDWNVEDAHGLGGLGTCNGCGAQRLLDYCGTYDAMVSSLNGIKDASTEVMRNRSATAASRNVAILGHYPDEFQGGTNFRKMYLDGLPAQKQAGTKVFNFFGHTHVQQCRGTSGGECVDFLTGGSGGCCGTSDTPAGFVAVAFGAGGQAVECFLGGECTLASFGASAALPLGGVCGHTLAPGCPGKAIPAAGNATA